VESQRRKESALGEEHREILKNRKLHPAEIQGDKVTEERSDNVEGSGESGRVASFFLHFWTEEKNKNFKCELSFWSSFPLGELT
jgi:hypothetical protein